MIDVSAGESHRELGREGGRRRASRLPGRVVLLLIAVVCLYLFAPSIGEVFEAWSRLGRIHPVWMVPAVLCAVASYACVWVVQAVAIGTRDWFAVITTQLAGNAFNRITPGGGATGMAMQTNMLTAAGIDATRAATALTVQSVLGTAALVAMPVFSIPFIIAGTQIPSRLLSALWIGIPVFLLTIGIGVAVFVVDAPLLWLARVIARVGPIFRRGSPPDPELGARLLQSRDAIREEVGPRWGIAVGASVLRWFFEYGVVLATLYGLNVQPDPALTLLAFVAASVLGLVPFTPGGLGFVEAGLTATLVLAGVPAGDALVTTLVYRLLTFWLPLPIGAAAAVIFRRRYPRAPD
jgi:uncharacterized protein (TIRG00374 family)